MADSIRIIADKLEQSLAQQMNKSGMMFRLFSRAKSEVSIRHKMKLKGDLYRSGSSKIQDAIGLRIVCYFPDDVEVLAFFLSCHEVIDSSVDAPNSSTFCPQRLNLILNIPQEFVQEFRQALPPKFAQYIDNTYEIQIRTIFSEGWHEVEHDLRYKCKEDWIGYESYSRTLNGVIATLETAEWSMRSLLNEMATKNHDDANYRAMLRNKMRIRLASEDFSPAVSAYLKDHPNIATAFMKIDRIVLMLTILNHSEDITITYDTVLLLANRIEINCKELQALEDESTSQKLDAFFKS